MLFCKLAPEEATDEQKLEEELEDLSEDIKNIVHLYQKFWIIGKSLLLCLKIG